MNWVLVGARAWIATLVVLAACGDNKSVDYFDGAPAYGPSTAPSPAGALEVSP